MDWKYATNRREVMKKMGVGSAIALGAVGQANASQGFSSDDIDSLLASQKVKSIKKRLPSIQLQKQRAEAVPVGPKDEPTLITKTEIPSNTGTLNIIEFSGVDEIEVIFEFNGHQPDLGIDWPQGTEAKLRGTEDGIILARNATEREEKKVAETIGEDKDEIQVGTTSETNGFHAYYVDSPNGRVEEYRLKKDSAGKLMLASRNVLDPEQDGAFTAASSCDCGEVFAHIILCLNDLGVCSLCLSSVVGGPAATIACVVATGCVSIADIWLGCTTLVVDRDCVVDCVSAA